MGRTDRGGTQELNRIVKGTKFPIVMTANDAYDSNIRTLKNKSKKLSKLEMYILTRSTHILNRFWMRKVSIMMKVR